MTKIERAPQKLVLQSGSTTLALDKSAGKAILQRKLLFWARKPVERPLSEIADVRVKANLDAASGAEVCTTMLVMRGGDGWLLSAADKQDAMAAAEAVRDFVGIRPS